MTAQCQLTSRRDRDGSFEPELIQKGQTRIDGMDDRIIGLYAAGLSPAISAPILKRFMACAFLPI